MEISSKLYGRTLANKAELDFHAGHYVPVRFAWGTDEDLIRSTVHDRRQYHGYYNTDSRQLPTFRIGGYDEDTFVELYHTGNVINIITVITGRGQPQTYFHRNYLRMLRYVNPTIPVHTLPES